MNRYLSVAASVALMGVACGKNSDATSASSATSKTAVSTPSKMAQQSHSSAQNQADTSETATTGSSDSSGTTSASKASKNPNENAAHISGHGSGQGSGNGGSGSGSGEGSIEFHGGVDFNQTISGDFNVAFSLSGRHNGASHETGNVSCDVKYKGPNNFDANIIFDINQKLTNGNTIRITTEPSINVKKDGSRELGKITRMLSGLERRSRDALDDTGAQISDDVSSTFDFSINHNDTVVVDTYVAGNLNDRTLSGTVTVTDNTDKSSAVITFNNVVRGKPSSCLCPSGGSIDVAYTKGGATEDHKYTFGSTCGEVTVTTQATATAATTISDGNNTATTKTNATGTATETWPLCVPTSAS